MNFALSAAVISVTAYMLMQLVFKRQGGAHPLATTAWVGVLLPVWVLMLVLGLSSHLLVFEFSWAYVGWTGLWAVLGVASMGLLLVMVNRLALTELVAYRKVFTLLLALVADVALMGVVLGNGKLVALGVVLAGSVVVSGQRVGKGVFPWKDVVIVAALCAVMALQLLAYQKALRLQPDVVSHICVAKAVFALFSLGLLGITEIRRGADTVSWGGLAAVAGLFAVGSIAEGFALKDLPMSVVVAVGLGMAGVFAAHDVVRGDIPRTPRALAGVGLVLAGLAMLAYVQ
ncbi:MAG: hypothetical protein WAZ18_00160 [Alphaproteobacteria bacterium]